MSQSGLKRLVATLTLLGSCVGCETAPTTERAATVKEMPTVNVPLADRQANWIGSQHEGSCTWATMVSLLRWQSRYRMADWIRSHYGDGEWPEDYAAKLDKAGVRYAYVTDGDVRFLEAACRTRRGCGITIMGGAHFVALVYLDEKWAAILDNNSVSKFKWVPRATLIAEWKASHGWAVTPIYTPAAPLPQ